MCSKSKIGGLEPPDGGALPPIPTMNDYKFGDKLLVTHQFRRFLRTSHGIVHNNPRTQRGSNFVSGDKYHYHNDWPGWEYPGYVNKFDGDPHECKWMAIKMKPSVAIYCGTAQRASGKMYLADYDEYNAYAFHTDKMLRFIDVMYAVEGTDYYRHTLTLPEYCEEP